MHPTAFLGQRTQFVVLLWNFLNSFFFYNFNFRNFLYIQMILRKENYNFERL
jgi:hypothetical protein